MALIKTTPEEMKRIVDAGRQSALNNAGRARASNELLAAVQEELVAALRENSSEAIRGLYQSHPEALVLVVTAPHFPSQLRTVVLEALEQ